MLCLSPRKQTWPHAPSNYFFTRRYEKYATCFYQSDFSVCYNKNINKNTYILYFGGSMQTAICEKNLAGINFSTSCLLHVNIMQRDWQEETAIQELQLPTWSGSETKNQHRLQGIFHCPVARGAELLSRVLLCWIQYTKAGKNASRWQTQQQVKWTYLLFYSIHHLSLEHVPNKWGLLCFATVQIFFQVDVSDFVQTLFGHNNADPDTGIVFIPIVVRSASEAPLRQWVTA